MPYLAQLSIFSGSTVHFGAMYSDVRREFVLPMAVLAEADYQAKFDRMIHG